jgi:hypothetical protein
MLGNYPHTQFLQVLVNIDTMVADLDTATDPIDLKTKQENLQDFLKKEITASALRAANAKAESIRRQRPAARPLPTPDS